MVKLIHSQSFHKINGKGKGKVVLNLTVRNFFLRESSDLQTEPHLFESLAIGLIGLIVDVLSDDDGVILPFLEAGVYLQSWDFNDSLSVELDDALVGPGDFVDIAGGDLQTAHFYLIFAALGPAEIFVGLEVAGHVELVLVDVGDVLFSDDFLDPVQGVDEPEAAVVALDSLLRLKLLN
jgi:hypothetical protein